MAVDRKDRWTAHRRVAQIRGGGGGGDRDESDNGNSNGNSNGNGDRPWVDPPINPRTPPTNPSQSFEARFQSARGKGDDGDAPTVPSGGLGLGEAAAAETATTATAAATPLVASSAPLLPEALPAGPVNPSSRSVPVLRLSSEGAAVETTVSLFLRRTLCFHLCGQRLSLRPRTRECLHGFTAAFSVSKLAVRELLNGCVVLRYY